MERPRRTRPSTVPLHTPEQITDAIRAILHESSVSSEDRIELLASALVVEALQPYWRRGRSPSQAHAALRRADAELADAVEAIAPMLLSRLESRKEANEMIEAVETLLGLRS